MASYDEIGIDLGSANVLIYARDNNIILNEPAVVALDRTTHTLMGIGEEARRMIGRTPQSVEARRPLQNGLISDDDMATTMLHHFALKVIGKRLFFRPRVAIALPVDIKDSRLIVACLFEAGARRTQVLRRAVAAALGAGLPIRETYGSMVVDIGSGNTCIAALVSMHVAVQSMSPVSGDQFDDAIVQYIRKKHHLLIGERTAEDIKINIGSALPRRDSLYMDITGRNLISGLPKVLRVTSDEIQEALEAPVQELLSHIHDTMEHMPSNLTYDIYQHGITLTGGGAQLTGLEEAVTLSLNLPCKVAVNPQECVARGCGYALDRRNQLEELFKL